MRPAGDPEKISSPLLSFGICATLIVATLAVYWQVRGFDFVNYDDADYVTGNAHVLSGLNEDTVRWAFTSGQASNWHPLTWLTHALDCQLFGPKPGPPHLVNLGFHLLNTALVFLVLCQLTGARWRSALVAAFFALHPLHVESVAWISERKDVLSTLFFLLTFSAYQAYARRGSWAAYGLALLAFALGLMSKPMLVTVPFVLLLLDWWPLLRVRTGEAAAPDPEVAARLNPTPKRTKGQEKSPTPFPSPATPRVRPLGYLLLEKVPFFLLMGASCVVTFIVQKQGGAVSQVLTLEERLANAAVAYARYLEKTFWPVKLSVLYPHPGRWPLWQVAGAVALLGVISTLVLGNARRRPFLATGWFWFLGMLVPVIGLVQVGVQSMADRYMYVPLVGLSIAVIWGLADVLGTRLARPWLLAIPSAVALAACAVVTSRQLPYWRESEALFRHAVAVTDRNYLAYNNLGFYLSNHGRAKEGKEAYLKSLAINPAYEDALNNLGFALAGEKKFAEAVPYYEAALRIRPNHPEVNNNFGNALAELGRPEEAMQHYQITLAQNPDHADANNNVGIALAVRGQLDQALVHFQRALRSRPNDAGTHSNLGNTYAAQHKFDDAIREYRECLRLRPEDAQANNNLANVLLQQGHVEEAIQLYESALRKNADNPEAHANLGFVLAGLGKAEEAAGHLQAALTLNPLYFQAHYGLAEVLLRLGRREEAISHYREALRIQPGFPPAKHQLELLAPGG